MNVWQLEDQLSMYNRCIQEEDIISCPDMYKNSLSYIHKYERIDSKHHQCQKQVKHNLANCLNHHSSHSLQPSYPNTLLLHKQLIDDIVGIRGQFLAKISYKILAQFMDQIALVEQIVLSLLASALQAFSCFGNEPENNPHSHKLVLYNKCFVTHGRVRNTA